MYSLSVISVAALGDDSLGNILVVPQPQTSGSTPFLSLDGERHIGVWVRILPNCL